MRRLCQRKLVAGLLLDIGAQCDFAYASSGGVDLVRIEVPSGMVTVAQASIGLGTISRTPSGFFGLEAGTSDLVRVNPITGAKSAPVVASIGPTGNGSTFGTDGALYFTSGTMLTHVDPNTAEATVIGPHGIPGINVAGLAFGPR